MGTEVVLSIVEMTEMNSVSETEVIKSEAVFKRSGVKCPNGLNDLKDSFL